MPFLRSETELIQFTRQFTRSLFIRNSLPKKFLEIYIFDWQKQARSVCFKQSTRAFSILMHFLVICWKTTYNTERGRILRYFRFHICNCFQFWVNGKVLS